MSTRILFVCMGNICRSPMLEGVLRHKLAAAGLGDRIRIDSAGLGPWHVGKPPEPEAIDVCAAHGIDIQNLRARQVTQQDFATFDWILCADRANLKALHALAPRSVWPRIALVLAWAGQGAKAEVPDPYGGSDEDFGKVYRLIDKATEAMLGKLRQPA